MHVFTQFQFSIYVHYMHVAKIIYFVEKRKLSFAEQFFKILFASLSCLYLSCNFTWYALLSLLRHTMANAN